MYIAYIFNDVNHDVNNQLSKPSFLSCFSFIIRLLEFRDFLFLQYQSKTKQEKQCRLI